MKGDGVVFVFSGDLQMEKKGSGPIGAAPFELSVLSEFAG